MLSRILRIQPNKLGGYLLLLVFLKDTKQKIRSNIEQVLCEYRMRKLNLTNTTQGFFVIVLLVIIPSCGGGGGSSGGSDAATIQKTNISLSWKFPVQREDQHPFSPDDIQGCVIIYFTDISLFHQG